MPEPVRPSASALFQKIDEKLDDRLGLVVSTLEGNKSNCAAHLEQTKNLCGSLAKVARDIEVLRVHVVDGNGEPGLISRVGKLEVKVEDLSDQQEAYRTGGTPALAARVGVLEAKIEDTRDQHEVLRDWMSAINQKLDQAADERLHAANEMLTQTETAHKSQRTLHITVAAAFLTSIASLFSGFLTHLIHGK